MNLLPDEECVVACRLADRGGQKTTKRKPKAASPVKKSGSMPEINLLDLTDEQDTSAADTSPAPPQATGLFVHFLASKP